MIVKENLRDATADIAREMGATLAPDRKSVV